MTAVFLNPPWLPFWDNSGNILAGGKVYTYAAGTSAPKNSYTDASGGTPNTNPVILDSGGKGSIWISGSYKIVIQDSTGTAVSTTDNVTSFQTGAVSATFSDGTFILQNSSDPTKQLIFDASGIAAGNTVTLTIPAANGTISTSSTAIPTIEAGGTVDAITATFAPAITLSNKTIVAVISGGSNATTTPTFAPNGLAAHTITKNGGAALIAGDIPPALGVFLLEYNLANTRWELLNPYQSTQAPNASYRNLLFCQNIYSPAGGTTAAGTYAMWSGGLYIGTTIYGGSTNQVSISDIYIAGADFPTVGGVTTKMRLRAQLHTNHVAPNGTITVSLYPLTRPGSGGGANTLLFTLGSPVATVTFTTPVADSSFNGVTADFAIPADGYYCLGITTAAAAAASSHTEISATLQMRNA